MKLTLKNVRLSFPDLFKPKSIGGSEPKYGASFLLDKVEHADQIKALREACAKVVSEKWPSGMPKGIKFCVHDGSEKDYEGYGPHMIYVSASNAMKPPLVDEFVEPIMENRKLYAGCIVNASIRLWAQDNEFGRRINAQLNAVQFVSDGEAFGEKPIDPKEEFQPLAPTQPAPAQKPPAGNADLGMSGQEIPF